MSNIKSQIVNLLQENEEMSVSAIYKQIFNKVGTHLEYESFYRKYILVDYDFKIRRVNSSVICVSLVNKSQKKNKKFFKKQLTKFNLCGIIKTQ